MQPEEITGEITGGVETDVENRMMAPSRFREAEARSVRLGRTLRRIGQVGDVDEDLMDRIGRAFFERDEPAVRLADAIRKRAGEPGGVTMAQFRRALEHGAAAVPDAPRALVEFFATVEEVPDWVNRELVREGGEVFARLGQNAADVLLQLSRIGSYRFGGPSDLLVDTGGLAGEATLRRLAETQKWAVSLGLPGALEPHGEGWRHTVHVRLMHALVNNAYESRWDIERWGMPINQADMASTLGLFDGIVLIGCRGLGVRITPEESRAYMHLWRYVGHLMGVDPDFLVDDESERHRITYHLLLAQANVTPAGPTLAGSVLAAQARRAYRGWPSALAGWRGRYEQERLLSMLTLFLGRESMRDLELPMRPPWAYGYVLAFNLLRYHVVGRTAAGRALLLARGRRTSNRIVASYFRGADETSRPLPV